MRDPLRRLYYIAMLCGGVAAFLLFLLIVPDTSAEDIEDVEAAVEAASGSALRAFAWLVVQILGAVAVGAGLLAVGLSPVVTYLEKVLANQEALERKLREVPAQPPMLTEYQAPAALPEHTLE